MAKKTLALAFLLIIASASAFTLPDDSIAENMEVIFKDDSIHHIGDRNISNWADPNTEGFNIEKQFIVGPQYKRAWIDFLVWDTDHTNNKIYVNGVVAGAICPNYNLRWDPCTIEISPDLLQKGKNNLTLVSGHYWQTDRYDNLQIDNLTITVEYVNLKPKIHVAKAWYPHEINLGEWVNVTVMLTNIGSKQALNLTVTDFKPSGSYLTKGSTDGWFTPLPGGQVYWYEYTIAPSKSGIISSWPGRYFFYDESGKKYEGEVEQTIITVNPVEPKVILSKNLSNEGVIDKTYTVMLTLTNNCSQTIHNVSVKDTLPQDFEVISGSSYMQYELIKPWENITFNYTVSPRTTKIYTTAALAYFQDREGNTYNTTSNYALFYPQEVDTTPQSYNTKVLVLVGIAATIVILIVVLVLVKH